MKKCEALSSYMQLFFADFLGEKRESAKSLWFSKYNTKRIYPILLKSGMGFLSGDKIFSAGFSKITHYKLPLASFKEHIDAVSQIFPAKMSEGEAIVFDLGPNFLLVQSEPHKFLCSFCEILKSIGTTVVECCTLFDFISKLNLSKESTNIDSLLPYDSYFTHMPSHLRSLTAQLQRFEFEPSLESIIGPRSQYYQLVARELSQDDSELAKIYEASLSTEERGCKLTSPGCFVYDIDDPFLKFITSKAEDIFSSEPIKKLVRRYLRLLALNYLNTAGMRANQVERVSDETISLSLIEKTIAEMLDYSGEYVPIIDRMGKLTRIYNIE